MAQLTVDTGINTKPVLNGIKDMNSAIRSLRSVVSQAGKSMDVAVVGYAKAMRNNAAASREAQIQIQELERTYERLRQQLDALAETKIYSDEYKKLQDYLKGAEKSLQDLNNAAVKDAKAIQNMQRVIALLKHDMRELENEGKAFTLGSETEEYQRLEKQANATISAANKVRQLADQKLAPLYLQQWREMTTVTGTVANGLARVANAAMFVGNALIHPFETLNRLIPFVLSGLAQLAKKALDAAISFGKMAISRAATILKNIASAALNAAANLAKMAGSAVISFLRRLAEAARNAAAQIAKVAGKAVVAGLKGIGSLASRAGKAILGIGKSAKRSNNSLGQAVKMLVRYGFGVRSIYMLVRRLRGALVDAFKNMAKQVPEVNKAISSLSASLGMLKNSMATAFQPILNAIAPILTQFMDMLSEAMTKVGMFFAALVGQDYVYKATKAQFDYAKSLKKTAKSAKEAENQLASFDELNILKAPNNNSNSTDADANKADGGKFIKTPLNAGIKAFAQTLKKMLRNGEFAKMGKLLAGRINSFIKSIDFDGYARKVGKLINGAVDLYNAFMEGIEWGNIGKALGTGLNGLLDSIDWSNLGRAFSQRINAIFGILTGFVETANFAEAGKALSDAVWGFFDNIKWDEIGTTIGKGITGIADAVIAAAYTFPWVDVGIALAEGANNLFGNIDPIAVANALVGIINGAFNALLAFIYVFDWKEHGTALAEGIKEFIRNLPTDTIGATLREAIKGILAFIIPGLEDEETWAQAGAKLAELLNTLFGKDQDGKTIWDDIADAIPDLASGIATAIYNFASTFEWGEHGKDFHDAVFKLVDNFPLNDLGGALSELLAGALAFMNETLGDPKLFEQLGKDIADFFNKITANKELWDEIGTTVNNAFGAVLSLGDGFVEAFQADQAADAVKRALRKIEWENIATETWDLAKKAFKKAGDFLNVLFSDESNSHYDPWEKMYIPEPGVSLGTKVGNKIREALGKIPWKSIGEELWNNAKAIGANIVDFIASLFSVSDEDIKAAGGDKLIAVGAKIGETISGAFAKIDWEQFGTDVGTGADNLFAAISKCFQTIRDNGTLKNAVDTFFGAIPDDIAESAANAADDFLKKLGKALLKKLWENIKTDLKDIGKLLVPELNDPKSPGVGRETSEERRARFEALGGGILPKSVIDDWTSQANDVGNDVVDSVVDGYVEQANTRKKDVQDANDDTFAIELIDPAKESTKDVADAATDGYVNQVNARKEDVRKANESTFVQGIDKEQVVSQLQEMYDSVSESSKEHWYTTGANYFEAFKAAFMQGGTVKQEFAGIIDDILGAGTVQSINNGKMTSDEFLSALQNALIMNSPATKEVIANLVGDATDTSENAATNAEKNADSFMSAWIGLMLAQQPDAETAVDNVFNEIWGALDAEGNGEMLALGYFSSFLGAVTDESGRVKPEFKDVVESMFGDVDSLENGEVNAQDFLKGIVQGMWDSSGDTSTKLINIVDAILEDLRTSPDGFDEHSPSKRAERYGEDFMNGFENGTNDQKSSVSSTLMSIFTDIANSGKSGLESVDISEPFDKEWSDISSTLDSNLSTMEGNLSGSMTDMKGTTTSGVQQQTKPFYDEWKAVIWIVRQSLGTISSELMTSMRDMGLTVHQGMFAVNEAMSSGMGDLAYTVQRIRWWNVGDYIVAGIQDGVQDNWKWLNRTVWNLAISLYNTACRALGIHSPSKLFREGVGQMIGLGVAEGFEDTEPTIMNSVTDVADAMVDKMASTDMKFDVDTETALSSFSDKIADSFTTLLDRLQAIADSVTFRTPDVAAGTVVPYNVAAKVGGDSTGLVEALEVSNDDLASVIIQATNNAAVAIVDAIQRHGGINNPNVSAQTSAIIDEINRRTRANGASPILM